MNEIEKILNQWYNQDNMNEGNFKAHYIDIDCLIYYFRF